MGSVEKFRPKRPQEVYQMNKIYKLIFLLMLLIGTASAAVYLGTNPEVRMFFDRPQPGPDVVPVQSMMQMDNGAWTNSYDYGIMTGDVLRMNMSHRNGDATTFTGIVYFDIECDEGLVDDFSGGIWDFVKILYVSPEGITHPCNNAQCITRISDTEIRMIPLAPVTDFKYGVHEYTNLTILFLPMAYGNYTITAMVDNPEVI